MGCDIHPYFETKLADGSWTPVWQPKPHRDWWYEAILEEACENGAHIVFTGVIDDNEAREALEAHFKAMPDDEIIAQFGNHPGLYWDFNIPYEARNRNYPYFTLLSGTRQWGDETAIWQPRGLPEDISPRVKSTYEYGKEDYHTASWQHVSKLLSEPRLSGYSNIKWIRDNIPDPDNTRMVYWYDN